MVSLAAFQDLLEVYLESTDQIPRLVFGFRSTPQDEIKAILDQMDPAGSFSMTPLQQRPEDISPIARYQIWSLSFKEDFNERWTDFETHVLPEFIERDWHGNVEELLEEVKSYCQSTAEAGGSRIVEDINTSVSAHWLKEQFERMHEKLLDRWNHEDSLSASEFPGETWRSR